MGFDTSKYIQVNERLQEFKLLYPEGSLQGDYEFVDTSEGTFIIYTAKAYRTPDDPRPSIGHAQEPFPGTSNFTRDNELENAETSAWGRALAGLAIATHRGVASAEEIKAARERDAEREVKRLIWGKLLRLAELWAEDQEGLTYSSESELVKSYLGSIDEVMPTKSSTIEELEDLLARIQEHELLNV